MRKVVISDIHGCAEELKHLLQKINAQPKEVLFLGDYVDKGPDSIDVLEMVREWCSQGAEALLGNHDELLIQWLEDKEDIFYYGRIGGVWTINSFLKRLGMDKVWYDDLLKNKDKENEIRKIIKDHYQEQIDFIKSRPLFKRESGFIFVHAGIDPIKGLEQTTREQFLHIRNEFIYHYEGSETVIFGHTQTSRIRDHHSTEVYFGDNNVIGIDGGCAFGGQLNALMIEDGKFTTASVANMAEAR
ncbi:metallophosphoesterase [Bacillus dakarensis]|uniref:metallophosphoesterase n=1 Tax=Robertmurraya dakarensis TaxID=1926278 RepID=UPI0009817268|nr:metallophosphoesterase [Bacillus dakarensis]